MCGNCSDKTGLLHRVVCHLGVLVTIQAFPFLDSSLPQRGSF